MVMKFLLLVWFTLSSNISLAQPWLDPANGKGSQKADQPLPVDPLPVDKENLPIKKDSGDQKLTEETVDVKEEDENQVMVDPLWQKIQELTIKNNLLQLESEIAKKESELQQLGYGKKEITGEIPRVDSIRIVNGQFREAVFVYFDGAEVIATVGDSIPYGYRVKAITPRSVVLNGPTGIVQLRMGGVERNQEQNNNETVSQQQSTNRANKSRSVKSPEPMNLEQ